MAQDKDERIERANKLERQLRLKEKSRARVRKEKLTTWRSEFEGKNKPEEKVKPGKKTMPRDFVKKTIRERFKEEKRLGIDRGPGSWKKLSKEELLKKAKESWK